MVLRGLCSESKLDRYYTAGDLDGNVIWYGYHDSFIVYEKGDSQWQLIDRKVSWKKNKLQ